MARATRVDLHRSNALSANALRIDVARDIAFDNGDVELVAQRFNGGQNGRRFARTGACEQIEHEYALLGEQRAVLLRKAVVLVENGLLHIYLHGIPPLLTLRPV